MSEVKSFKTFGGDELVSEVVAFIYEGETLVKYKLRKPQVLQFQPVAPGKMGLAFVPWLLSNPELDVVEVPIAVLPFCFPTAAEVERQYLTQMSGIQIASAGSVS